MPQPRDLVTCVLLSIVTCGIYLIWWSIQLGGDIALLRGDDKPPVTRDILLLCLTCGVWSFFIAYQWPLWIQDIQRARGRTVDPNLPVLSLVVNFFGMHLVPLILMQQAMNELLLADARQDPRVQF